MATTGELRELEKLKVSDLKKELKNRGLSTVGIKSELIGRLQQALDINNASVESAETPSDEDLIEDVLGDEEILSDQKSADLLLSEDLILTPDAKSKTITMTLPTPIEKENSPKSVNVTSAAPVAILVEKNEENASKSQSSPNDVKTLSSEERLELRAKRFNMPLGEDARKEARALRFGVKNASSSTPAIKTGAIGQDIEKLKQRASRFGVVTSTTVKTIVESDRLLKRKERFGAVVVTGGKAQDDLEAKKMKRAERFSRE